MSVNGYRNVYSRFGKLPSGKMGTTVFVDTWDDNGNPVTKKIDDYRPHLYYEASKELSHLATATSIYNTPLIKKEFITSSQRRQWVESHPGIRLFENLPIARQFMLNQFHGTERLNEFRKFKLNVMTFDLELAVKESDKFPEAELAEAPINVITVHCSSKNVYHTWYMTPTDEDIVKPYVEEGFEPVDMSNRFYHRFRSESKLLADFLDFWSHNRPDVLTGWNVSAFDMPYLFNRCQKVLGDIFDAASYLSPVGQVYFVYDENLIANILKISGVSILDYMYLYKFKFEKGKPSYALDAILDDELGLSKMDHSEHATFYDFYTKNFSKFVEYNIMDVERVVRLDKKKQFIDLARIITNIGLVELEAIYHTKPYVQGALTAQAKYNNRLFLTDSGLPEPEGGFKGAYVHDTNVGYYDEGGYTFDLNSLYPSLMRLVNASLETKVGMVKAKENGNVIILLANGKEAVLSDEKFESLLDTTCCISENGVLFVKHERQKGVMTEFLEFLYNERRRIKKEGLDYDVKINDLRVGGIVDGEEVEILKTASTLCGNTQMAFKIMLNSVYGLIGLKHYCGYDKDIAEAVTLSGQRVIKTSLDIIERLHKEQLGYDGEHPTIAGDTDSLMNNGAPIYRKLFGDERIEWNKEQVGQFKEMAQKICDDLNNQISDFCAGYFHSSVRTIEFKLETVFTHSCFLKRKHYVYRLADKEGSYMIGSPKQFKYVGVDIKRNQIPKPIQKILKSCIEQGMLENWNGNDFSRYMTEQLDKFMTMPIEDIALQFAYKTERKPIGFLQLEPRTHMTAKVAIYYNQLHERLNIKNEDRIKLGDNAKYVYVKPTNQFGIDVIGFKDRWPEEFKDVFEVDYSEMFKKLCSDKLIGFCEVLKWPYFNHSDIDKVDIFVGEERKKFSSFR
jgi:DNA polymerase elongation subunit (family B)